MISLVAAKEERTPTANKIRAEAGSESSWVNAEVLKGLLGFPTHWEAMRRTAGLHLSSGQAGARRSGDLDLRDSSPVPFQATYGQRGE